MAYFSIEHATRVFSRVVVKDKNKKLKQQDNGNLRKSNRDKSEILHVAQNDIMKQ